MPFTFSHPAIVLPFSSSKKKFFSLTGLIAGSMVPDFEFLFRLRETDCFAHTWAGFFEFDLPFALLLSFVFHLLIRNTLIFHLPKALRQRFTFLISFNWKRYFARNMLQFFISAMIGIGSHIFLDAFTHSYGLFVHMNNFFIREVEVMHTTLRVYFILQLLSSLLGMVYITWYVFNMEKGADVNVKTDYYGYWISLILLWILLLVTRLFVYPQYRSRDDIIAAFVGCFIYSLLIVSVYYTNYAKKIKMARR